MAQAKFVTDPKKQSYDATYERDARHVAVANYTTFNLITPNQTKYHHALEQIYHDSLNAGLPDIACTPSQAKFLMLQCRMCNAKNILEIGTLGGYSAGWMASAGSDTMVTTIEINRQYATIAVKNLTKAGLSSQVEVLTGAALDILPKLNTEVQSQRRAPFDLVFIDANKQDNLAYFNLALSMTRHKAAIIVDNVVRNGKVSSEVEAKNDDRVQGVRNLIEALGKDSRVDATVIQTVDEKNYDGFLLAVKH